MAKGTRYTPEFKAKAVRLLTESRGSYSSETKAIEQVAKEVVPEKLRTLDHGRPWSDDQFASTRLSSNRDMSR